MRYATHRNVFARVRFAGLAAVSLCAWAWPASAQEQAPLPPIPSASSAPESAPETPVDRSWGTDGGAKAKTTPPVPLPGNGTTIIERAGGTEKTDSTGVRLIALLTEDGQEIDQGLVWRVFQAADTAGKLKLVAESRDASPQLKLQPGDYTINAGFGRAHLTRRVRIAAVAPATERFVINAGGLRLNAMASAKPVASGLVSYAIFSDDRDQSESRTAVMSGAKPGLIIRLNAGIYRIVSQYGDGNARIETDVTVEAGKLTEATVAHVAGKAMFKLVTRAGGEALPDTTWMITSATGDVIKETHGALPSHYLAPGTYAVAARSGGQTFQSTFSIVDGSTTVVEVLASATPAGPSAIAGVPTQTPEDDNTLPGVSLDFKNP